MLLLYGKTGNLARNWVRMGHSSSSARDSATADQVYNAASRYGQCWVGSWIKNDTCTEIQRLTRMEICSERPAMQTN